MENELCPNELWIRIIIIILTVIGIITLGYKKREKRKKQYTAQYTAIGTLKDQLGQMIASSFLVSDCSRCNEANMKLLAISPNARSIEYQCVYCNKKLRASAGSPQSEQAAALLDLLTSKISQFHKDFPKYSISEDIIFSTPASPLPYQQTSREPISEAMRAQVWRRDRGLCTKCGCQNNLEFDHIIPVSKGGATSVANLQLLCKQCNLTKSNKI